MFKRLFFNPIKQKSRIIFKDWLESPINKENFIEVISNLSNINLENEKYLDDFYYRYVNELFPKIITKNPKDYKTYFWRTSCLNIEPSSNQDKYWLDRGYSIEETKNIKSKKYGTCSIQHYINKGYSEEDAKRLLNNKTSIIQNKGKKTKKDTGRTGGYSINKYIDNGYSEEDAKVKVTQISNKISNGIKEWNKENPDYYKDGKRTGQIKYWINKGFSEEEAIQKVKESQSTFTLEKCIQRHGKIEGTNQFKERQEKWKKSLEENFRKYGDSRTPSSKFASDYINKICNDLNIKIPKKEKWISNGILKCSYDFTYNKKIIEFNGDYWHCNPNIYLPNYFNSRLKMTAQEKWNLDEKKINLAKSYGYDVLVIWESDNKKESLKKCLEFLKYD